MTFSVERLQAGDIARFRAMNLLFGAVFEDPESYTAAPPSDEYVEALLRRDGVFLLVAIEQGEIIGALVGYELVKFEQARSEIYLYDLAIAEAHRRRGVATALIDRLREIAAERSAWVIYVQADYGDDPAIALYTKLGRREDVLHFDIDPAR